MPILGEIDEFGKEVPKVHKVPLSFVAFPVCSGDSLCRFPRDRLLAPFVFQVGFTVQPEGPPTRDR